MLKEYLGDDYFKLYFGELETLEKIICNTNILNDYTNFIYVRVRDEEEYKKMNSLVKDLPIKIIVEKENLDKINSLKNNNLYDIVLQIDTFKELSSLELYSLKRIYPIEYVMVGQFIDLSNDFQDYILYLENKYKINRLDDGTVDYASIDKNAKISNDIYTCDVYFELENKLYELISDVDSNDSEATKFYSIYKNIVEKINYAYGGFGILDNQTLYGGLIKHCCVCEGFSKILQQSLALVDIESIIIGGSHPKEDIGHVWNQVKIDGKWYNADSAADSVRRANNQDICMDLIDDSKLYYITDSPMAKKCNEMYYDNTNNFKKSK